MRFKHLLTASILAAFATGATAPVSALAQNVLPSGGKVVAGSVAIGAPVGSTQTITQSSNRAVVNWNSFSIGQPNTVNFAQPGSSAAILNRVTGATTSTLAGHLNANGQVYLVNPNGIAITKSGAVNVGGGFVASTLDIANGDFLAGHLAFSGKGASAPVSNAGTITIGRNGFTALIGGSAANSGTIRVPLGKVGLGSGEQATLDLNGDGFLQVAAPTGAKTAQGQALVSNSGKIVAPGGTVELKAATVATAIRDAVNMSGIISANSVSGRNGSVMLGGGPGGNVAVTGALDVSAPASNHAASGSGVGGSVKIGGAHINLGNTARIDARGPKGGGTVSIGGGPRPLPPANADLLLHDALTANVSAGAVIDASATRRGNGGGVTLWSDTTTVFAGTIRANGGSQGGNGGTIETSSRGQLTIVPSASARAAAPGGKSGTWVIDPSNLIIDGNAATAIGNALNAGTNVVEQTTATTTGGFGTAAPGTGDIDVNAAIAWGTASTLTLTAYNSINVNAAITIGGAGHLSLLSNNAAANNTATITVNAPITINSNGALDFTTTGNSAGLVFGMGQGNAQFTGGANAGAGLTINSTSYTLLYDTGATATGVQSMNNSSGAFALATPLTNATMFTAPPVAIFQGTFNGLGNTISNLTITDGVNDARVGLFGQLGGSSSIANIGLIGGSVTGPAGFQSQIGALAGQNSGTVSNAYATATISGSGGSRVGGLIGENNGTIIGSYATGTVSSPNGAAIGGLVGTNNGTIASSYATGTASGGISADIGGLVGHNNGAIRNSYATGIVIGDAFADLGGLVGDNDGSILNAYATGAINGTAHASAGGLVGDNDGSIINAFATGKIAGGSGAVIGGLVGDNSSGTIVNGFWDTTTSDIAAGTGQTNNMSAAPVGETTAGLASASVLATLNGMGTVWANINNQTTPYLLSNAGPVYVAADTSPLLYNLVFTPAQLQAINNNPTGNYALANDLDMSGMSGFVPLGSTIPFAGTFNGLDNVIANLTVSTTGGPTGLFGQIALGATVKNIGLIDSIVGSSGSGDVGGLVGFNNGGAISEAYATGTATGATGSDVGGLVGFNALNATISNAYATGAVIGNGSLNIGGLAGLNAGTISNAYAIASVDGVNGTNIGGLVGATLAGSTITNVYAAGAVNGTGSTSVGGLIGQNQGMLTTGYWNEDRAGMLTGVGTGTATGATGLSGDAVVTATSYAGFAFTTTPGLADNWVIVDTNGSLNNAGGAAGGTMPLLAFEGSGTIHNAHQLQLMAMNAGTDYTLARNIDATATGSSTSAASGTDVWGRGGFIPVGNGIVGQFAGTFDGGGKTITNLTINTSQFYAGLFGQSSGVIRNVGLTGGSVVDSDMTAGDAIGGLVGYNDGKISGAFSGATVSGGRDTGGLVGFNAGGSITDSYAVGAVSAPNNSRVGGLVGLNFGGDISNTYATGVVNGSGAFVGGLVGDNPGTVTTSYWDIGTSGQIGSSGGTGMTTAQLQAALPTGFTSPVWNIIAGVSYPYLAYQFPNGTPQIVSGTLYTGTTAGSPPAGPEVTVSALSNGNAVNSALTGGAVATGGNGYFYYLLNPGTIAPSGSVLLYSNSIVGSGAAFVDQIADGNARDTAIYGNTLHIVTPGGNSSTINASLLAAAGGNSTAITILGTLPNLTIDAAHDLTIDQPLAFQNGAVTLNSGGAIMQTPAGAILAARLTGRSVGGASLDAANAIGTFGSWSDIGNGSQGISLTDNTALTVNGTVSSASGPITLATTTGDLTIAGNLAADGSTISLRSAGGIVETTGLLDPVALLLSSVNSVTMTGANDVNLLAATLTGPNASLTFNSIAPSLTIGTVNGVTGVTTNNGAVTLSASAGSMTLDRSINAGSGMVKAAALGDLTIDAGASVTGGSVILATKGNFTNAAGVGAISVSPSVQPVGPGMIPVGLGGHWLVYSTDPSLDNDGGLTPEFIQYNATYALDTQTGTAPAAPGNGFLYSLTPSLTVIGISKIYDGTTALPTAPGAYSTSGAITGDIVQLNITGASGGYASSDVGNGINVSLTGATVNATRGGIPVFGYQPQTVSNEPIGTISPAGLLITASDQSKTYGETLALGTTGFTAQGLVGGDFVTGVTLASAGSPGAAGVGQYAINASNPTGHGLGNYTIGFADGELTVNPAALLITASNQSKTYGQNLALGISAFTTQGLVNGDTVTGVALNSAGAPASAGVAQYAITASNPTGNGLSNYTIGFADGRLTVNPAALLITASNQAKTYGQNFDLGTTDFTALGLVNGDTVTGVTLNSAGAAAAAGIGQYAIGASNPTGNGLGNYTISVANGKLTVNPAALLITASDQAKTYGQNLALGTTGFTTQGLVDGDMVTGVTLNSAGAPASASVGQYAITATNPAGNGLANYTISVADGKLTVNPATLLIAAANQSKTYGQTLSLGTTDFTTQGLVNGDTVTGIMLKSAGTPATAGVGQYAIGANDPTGSGLANYTISFADGSLTVNPAALLITTLNQSKTYGQNLSLGMTGFTAQGLVNGDTVTAVTLNSAGAPAPAGVGQYAIGASNPTGSNIANYAVTVTQGTLTVNPAALLITATDESKTYGQDQAFGATDFAAQGLVNGDRVTGVTLSSTGASAGAGVGQYAIVASDPTGGGLANYTISVADGKLTVNPAALLITATNRSKTYGQNLPLGSTDFAAQGLVNGDRVNGVTLTSAGASAAAGVAASPYSIVASNPSGSGLANYTIGFADGRLTIEPAPLTVTADNQVRAAGIANPPLTFAVTGGELFNGDALSGALATAATASSAAGAYPITEGSLSASANYRLGFVDGVLTVQPGSIPIPTPPPLPPPSPALPAPATTVAALTTLANLVTPATVEQAAEAAQTGSQKANSPESLALAALSNFRAAACSGSNALPPALFVVLPSATGKAIGGIVVSNGAAETVLDQSFAAAELHGGTLAPCQVSRTAVDTTFHQAIAARPVLPRHFLLYFAPNSDRLTPQSMAQYREALSDVTQRRAYQIEVVGFTDSTGAQADDQKSSLAQAETVRRLLARDRLDPRKISIAGRGKLNPLIPTADQVREPRNRRVEIWVR